MQNKPTVLIVDDDTVSLNLLTKLVEKQECQALAAENGSVALELIRGQTLDLVIADYDMPGVDGLELLKIVKNEFPRLPYILVTAYSNTKVIRDAWEEGAFDFFQKPVFVDRMNQTIRLAIEYGHLSIARRRFPKLEEVQADPEILNLGVVRELAVALSREDLLRIVEEYETHARIELEQIFRYSLAHQPKQVKSTAHRLAGSSVNLGLVKLAEELRAIEARPEAKIAQAARLEQMLERSIYWLKQSLAQIYQDVAV